MKFAPYAATCALVIVASGCMFDVVSITQKPTVFSAASGTPETFVLRESHSISIGTGFPTKLKAGTKWAMIGSIPEGLVFRSRDQELTVEASNIHEAALVVDKGAVVGFYLVVEKTFCPAKQREVIEQ